MTIIEELASALKKRKANVVVKARVKGMSGIEHEVDLLVRNGENYAFVLLNECSCENFIKQFVKTVDLHGYKSYLLVESSCAEKLFENIKPKSTIIYTDEKDLLSKILSLVELKQS